MNRLTWRRAPLPADSFSVVMATGIVSIAAFDNGYPAISYVLAATAIVAFGCLVVLAGWRLWTHGRALGEDLRDPSQVFALYTFVAACDVLDARLGLTFRGLVPLLALGAAALAAWLVLVPLVWRALRSTSRVSLRRGARGGWLLAAVGTQSLAVIAVDLSKSPAMPDLLVLASAWWVLGVVAYVGVCALIVWRLIRDPLEAGDVTPDSWVLMGALAIATLAGASIVAVTRDVDARWLEVAMTPSTLAVWAVGTAWIPLLAAAEVWRLMRANPALRYERTRWATVFPLGMYAAATHALSGSLGFASALRVVSAVFFWAALLTWCLTSYGLARAGYRALRWN